MIRDDFEYEGAPKTDVWLSGGNPFCRGGKLNLPSDDDFVRSRNPIKLDDGAKIKLIIASGEGDMYLTPYALTVPPHTVEGVPYFRFGVHRSIVSCGTRTVTLGSISGVLPTYTLEIECLAGKVYFYVSGYDWLGKTTARTLIAQTANDFHNKDVYVYLVGGSLSVDSIDASSGSENPMTLAMYAVSQLIYILPMLLVLILVPKMLSSTIKEIKQPT